jgi:hypothetical protein
MLRAINLLVIAALICGAAYVYKVKFEATLEAERVAKLRNEIRRERDGIAILRAEWTKIERPERVQALAQQHLKLKPVDVAQFDDFSRLPERPAQLVPPGSSDPIGAIIEIFADAEVLTGTLPDRPGARR